MADRTGIEWTDATWNPVRGCSRVSAGCQHCYAETVAARFSGPGMPYAGLIHPKTRGWNGTVRFLPDQLLQPLRWKRPRRIFVNSMSDLFHESLRDDEIAAVFGIMAEARRHTFQVLTKRPERMLRWFQTMALGDPRDRMHEAVKGALGYEHPRRLAVNESHWPLRNVHIGVSVEDQAAADERMPLLRAVPAAVRYLSMEPLLGPVDLRLDSFNDTGRWDACGRELPLRRIDWVIVGGESGHGARPMHPAWARSLRDQCAAAGVPFFFKQWGEWLPALQFNEADVKLREDLDGRFESVWWEGARWVYGVDPMEANEEPEHWLCRVGKKRAGRLLDGVEHDAFPEAHV